MTNDVSPQAGTTARAISAMRAGARFPGACTARLLTVAASRLGQSSALFLGFDLVGEGL